MKLKELIHHFKKGEIIILVFLLTVLAYSGYRLGKAFYADSTEPEFIDGGVYTEGAVGTVSSINPLYINQGAISQDISQLVFSGLTKYDSQTGEIVGDLANVQVNDEKTEYSFVIKDNVRWHDDTPLTADDVVFTYNDVIKNPEFSGTILNFNDYSGVDIEKRDNRTVVFKLEKPDAFFLAKTMVGILPKHLLEKENVSALDTAEFNTHPIGSGPYQFVSKISFPTHDEYGLESFDYFYGNPPHIESLLFKVFPDEESLEANLSTLDGIRIVPDSLKEKIVNSERFALSTFELPQYVAVFINNDAEKLKVTDVRLALQLGTDKDDILKKINENVRTDTPLLEIDQENWVNKYSVTKANGALFETEWQIPNKEEVAQSIEDEIEKEISESANDEKSPTAEVTYIDSPNDGKDWKTSTEPLTITGTAPEGTVKIWVDDYELQKFDTEALTWNYLATQDLGNLVIGKNIYEIFAEDESGEKTLIDSISIEFSEPDSNEERAIENDAAPDLPTRENADGEKLILNLVTSNTPSNYSNVAQILREQWKKIGVELKIEVLDPNELQQRIGARDYDLLLFGQNLGYNLDAYPYWHSSQANEDGVNLSQFKNFVVDSLLEKARTDSEEGRKKTLKEIQEIISQEVPAVFLYSPSYYTALSKDVKSSEFKHLATISDRLINIELWFASANRRYKEGKGPLSFFGWAIKQF